MRERLTVELSSDNALKLVIALHRLVRSLRIDMDAPPVNPTQLLVLTHLIQAGPTRIGELAARVGSSQPTATTVVAALAAAGLVCRVPDTADGRAVRVELTERGRATMYEFASAQAELIRARAAALTSAERAVLAEAGAVFDKLTRPE